MFKNLFEKSLERSLYITLEDFEIGKQYKFNNPKFIRTKWGSRISVEVSDLGVFFLPSNFQTTFKDQDVDENQSIIVRYLGKTVPQFQVIE